MKKKKTPTFPSDVEKGNETGEENFHNQLVPDNSFSPETDTIANTPPLLPDSSSKHKLSLIAPENLLVTSDKLSSHKLRSVYNSPHSQGQSEKSKLHENQSRKAMGAKPKDKQEWTSPYAEWLAQTVQPSSRVL